MTHSFCYLSFGETGMRPNKENNVKLFIGLCKKGF